MQILPRWFHDASTLMPILLHFYHALTPIRFGHVPAMLVLNMFKLSMAASWSFTIFAILLRPYNVHEDPLPICHDDTTIAHDSVQILELGRSGALCDRGLINHHGDGSRRLNWREIILRECKHKNVSTLDYFLEIKQLSLFIRWPSFISGTNFILRWVEHEKSFMTSGQCGKLL